MIDAILLDRDGTINVERADYVKSIDEFVLLSGALAALGSLAALPVPIIVVTNQSVIGRGIVTRAAVDAIHAHMCSVVSAAGGRIDAVYLCPHHPAAHCACRKPNPGLLVAAAADFQVDLARCVFIGDSVTDFAAAQAVGCHAVLLRTGRQAEEVARLAEVNQAVVLMDNLPAAVNWLVGQWRAETGICGSIRTQTLDAVQPAQME